MQIRFIIQARLLSTRLPKKSMALVGDRPLAGHILDRLQHLAAPEVSITAALPKGESNELASFFENEGVRVYLGATTDVLSRYQESSADLEPDDFIVRLTGDNPFLDHREAQKVIEVLRHKEKVDLIYPLQLPLGMGFEIIRVGALRSQLEHPLGPHHKEHVSVFIKEHPELYQICPVENYTEHPQIRLTVDYHEDLEMARKCYQHFASKGNPHFCSDDVYDLYRREPHFFDDNLHMEQKPATSYEKS